MFIINLLNLAAIGFPTVIFIITIIAFYKLFIRKKNITAFYTPFDEITGQSTVVFHEEQEVIAEDDEQGDDKNKNKSFKKGEH